MAIVTGIKGDFTSLSGHSAKFKSWSLTVPHALYDTSGFSDTAWDTFEGGASNWTVTAVGKLQNGSGNGPLGTISNTGGSITLQCMSGATLSGTAILAGITINIDRNNLGNDTVSYTFVGSGALSQTWT
jgi:hypothetical protein